MYHPDTIVHWLDIDKEYVGEDTISSMFQYFALLANVNSNRNEVLFKNPNNTSYDFNVKLKDWYGWTNVISISKTEIPITWRIIELNGLAKLHVCDDTLIPVCSNIARTFRGFNGEVKYRYEIRKYKELQPTDFFRVRDIVDNNFTDDIRVCGSATTDHYYSIVTKSSFFNGNNILLYGRDVQDSKVHQFKIV